MLEQAAALKAPMPGLAAIREVFQAARAQGHGREDICAVVKALEKAAGAVARLVIPRSGRRERLGRSERAHRCRAMRARRRRRGAGCASRPGSAPARKASRALRSERMRCRVDKRARRRPETPTMRAPTGYAAAGLRGAFAQATPTKAAFRRAAVTTMARTTLESPKPYECRPAARTKFTPR